MKIPFFLETEVKDLICSKSKNNVNIDKKLPWYFFDNIKKTIKEQKEIEKQLIVSLKPRAIEIKQSGSKLSVNIIQKQLFQKEYCANQWQIEMRKWKNVNNLNHVFNEVFYECASCAGLENKSNQFLEELYQEAAVVVAERLKDILERNIHGSKLSFHLPPTWTAGKKMIKMWLIEEIDEFKVLKPQYKKYKSLREKLIYAYGFNIIKNRKPIDFAVEIYEEDLIRKNNGEKYEKKSIERELFNIQNE